ncbi:MAG: metallophosphoesterase [Bacilli bacterium]|nr:metallophosphoesterase [Bacilli bacterium]
MKLTRLKLKNKYKILILILIILISLYIYAHKIEPNKLVVNEYKVENKNLPQHFHGVKLVHISDLHYGRTIKKKQLKRIVNKINLIEPDIVVFTGDLIDKDVPLTTEITNELITELKKINVTVSKYAVSGNHDKFFPAYENIITKSRFSLLDNDYDLIYYKDYEPILISGLNTNDIDIKKAMAYLNKEETDEDIKKEVINYKIAIMHMPDYITDLNKYKIDLVLAGHSHNGQVRIPLIGSLLKPIGAKKYNKPYYQLNNTDLFISAGLGTSILELRTFNKPSINFYRLAKSK